MNAKEFIAELRQSLFKRRWAYQATFRAPTAEAVLKDLARFCRAHETTFHPDARMQGQLEGRREVWLRIQQHMELTPEQLWELYSGRPAQRGDGND